MKGRGGGVDVGVDRATKAKTITSSEAGERWDVAGTSNAER